ncbi:MAG: S9 family peptidase, partial [Pyrinomonadaceae bacterium]
MLFISNCYPGAGDDEANKKIAAERKTRKYKARAYDIFPVRYWDHWLEETQPHVFIQSLEPGAKAKDLLAGTRLVAAPGFAGRTASSSDELDAEWSPDGTSILFNATTQKDSAAYANYPVDIFQVSVSGGEPKRLTTGDGNYTGAVFSPDGKRLFCQFTPDTQKVYNLARIAVFNWQGNTFSGKPQIITSSFDRSIESFAVTPDSRTIYLLAEDAGLVKLYSVPATGGEVTPALETTSGVYTNLVIPEKSSRTMIIANWDSAVNPPEIYRLNPERKTRQALTDFTTQAASAIDWQPLKSFWLTSKAGKRIHSMVALPPAFDEARKYPLLVVMHGGPYSMWRDSFGLRWNYHLLTQPGYVVLLTNYTGSTGFGERFAQEIQGDPFAGPGNEINEAADEAIRLFKYVDGTRQAAAGASYGGHLVNWMQATTTRYKCLISHAGLINLESQWGTSDTIYSREVTNGGPVWEQGGVWRTQNPIRYAKDFRTPILLSVGENDFRVPINQTLENWSVLQRLKIPSRLIVFPEENHWIS